MRLTQTGDKAGSALNAASLGTIMSDTENRAAIAILVDVATELARSVRINVTLPEDLLLAIDRNTNNRSRFLAEAARHKLQQPG